MQAFSLYTFILPILLCLIKGEVIPSVAPELLTAWCGAFVFTVLVPPVSSAKSREVEIRPVPLPGPNVKTSGP